MFQPFDLDGRQIVVSHVDRSRKWERLFGRNGVPRVSIIASNS